MGTFKSFKQNPNIDLLFGFFGNDPVPTKQESYKLISPIASFDANGDKIILERVYQKKPNSNSIQVFCKRVQESAGRVMNGRNMYLKPALIEVVLDISINQKRFFDVDVDNLSKTVLDALKGHVFEDDSQVINLICQKHIHPLNINGILIGVTEIKDNRKGILQEMWLFKPV